MLTSGKRRETRAPLVAQLPLDLDLGCLGAATTRLMQEPTRLTGPAAAGKPLGHLNTPWRTEALPNLDITSSAPDQQSPPDNGTVAALAAEVGASVQVEDDGPAATTLAVDVDFLVRFDNESSPGTTVVVVQGVNQENLLADISATFSEMGIGQASTPLPITSLNSVQVPCSLLKRVGLCSVQSARLMTQNNRVLDVFVVLDLDTDGAVAQDKWASVQDSIMKKLETRKLIATSKDDSRLTEQISFLTSRLEKVVEDYGESRIVEAANTLQRGFEALRDKEDPRKRAELLRYIDNMDEPTLNGVIRLYYVYSSLLNVADEAHAHRTRREQVLASQSATPLWYASFDHTLRLFRSLDVPPKELQLLLNRLEYYPVLTAHPTEARRREILTCLHRIFVLCHSREDPRLSAAQRSQIDVEVDAEIEILWRTDEMRGKKATVLEEIQTGLDYFRYSLFEAVCTTYRYAENSIRHVYPNAGLHVPSLVKFGSWIGGDRDGNPFVLPETTEMAALLQSRLILAEYICRCRACQDMLTHSLRICNVSPELLDALEKDADVLSSRRGGDANIFDQEPYRLKFRVMRHRLEHNVRIINQHLRKLSKDGVASELLLLDDEYNIDDIEGLDPHKDAYMSEIDFLQDLRVIDASLRANGDQRSADSKLKDLIRLAETFGFFLCALDVRQESSVHSEAVAECLHLLGCSKDYLELDNQQRMAVLEGYFQQPAPYGKREEVLKAASDGTQQVVAVLESCANIMDMLGPRAVASYVISMTRQSSHILEVRMGMESGSHALSFAPLFETIPDLEHMPEALASLLHNPTYQDVLASSGGIQEVMLGYSDSCKDGGITASAYNLYKAQEVIREITTSAGVKSRIFHGRGGTVGRGAGPTHESVLAQPAGSVAGKIKFTEQGEVITYRYGNAETATFELTVGITGLLKASHPATRANADIPQQACTTSVLLLYYDIMTTIASNAEKAYRDLTDDTEGFYDYFYEATVVNEVNLMNIGSRPSRRKSIVRDKSSLRAIPWVFGWAQSRVTLPAWFGVGSGLLGYTKNHPVRIQELQRMYIDWPFFRNFLSNVQMALFKASMEIANEYSSLCSNRITQKLIYDLVLAEYDLTKSQFLMIAQQNSLEEDNRLLKNSFETRRKYLDPLNHIQVILLGRRRDPTLTEEEKLLWEKPLIRTMKAIASNMRNTG
eukprot:SM000126S26288  [mRNA]  locus=s126:9904:18596:+ [translate_table: standard]